MQGCVASNCDRDGTWKGLNVFNTNHFSATPIQPFGNFRSIKPLYGTNAWLRAKNPKYKLVA